MSKYLGFMSAGFDFLCDVKNVVEIFDVDSSQEDIDQVLIGSDNDVYWRGTLSRLIDLTSFLRGENGRGECYLVCINPLDEKKYCIMKVDNITSLYDFADEQFTWININEKNLTTIANKVCIVEDSDQMFLLVSDITNIFSANTLLAC